MGGAAVTSMGDAAQMRDIAEAIGKQVAKAAIHEFNSEHPELSEAKIPPPLKWFGIIASAVLTLLIGSGSLWLFNTVSEMQVTLARLDERIGSGSVKDARFDDLERRVTKLEGYHSGGKQ